MFTLTNNQNYAGPTLISGGVLALHASDPTAGSLVDYYTFAGNANDLVGTTAGTLGSNATLAATGGPFGTGAVTVSGTINNSVTMGALPSMTSGTQARTISAWVNQASTPTGTFDFQFLRVLNSRWDIDDE